MSDDQIGAHSARVAGELPTEMQQPKSAPSPAAGSSGTQPGDLAIQPSTPIRRPISARKLAANRRNAQKSTGPKTARGKAISSWNSLKHGLLSQSLYRPDQEEFSHLLASLQEDLQPMGTLEQVLVEKIAYDYWRAAKAGRFEDTEFSGRYAFQGEAVDKLIRYQAMINRKLFQAINQLERLQRLRRGEDVPAPLHAQISHDRASSLGEGNSER